jgi:hypothetical protein
LLKLPFEKLLYGVESMGRDQKKLENPHLKLFAVGLFGIVGTIIFPI